MARIDCLGKRPVQTSKNQPFGLSLRQAPRNVPEAVAITIFFADREPAGLYRVVVPPRRTFHLRFNDLKDPEPIPLDTDYSSVFESDVPIVVQHTRLDSRRAEISLMSTVAYSQG
jgi:hypothetical protein